MYVPVLICDITVDSPWQAIKEAFKLLLLNDLENAIDSLNMEEMSKEVKEEYHV